MVGDQIVKTMMIQSVMPYVNFTSVHVVKFLARYKDSGRTQFEEKPDTKCITI